VCACVYCKCVVLYVSVCTLPVCPMSKNICYKSIQYNQVVRFVLKHTGKFVAYDQAPYIRLNEYCDYQKMATSLPEIAETIHLYYMFHSHVDGKLRRHIILSKEFFCKKMPLENYKTVKKIALSIAVFEVVCSGCIQLP